MEEVMLQKLEWQLAPVTAIHWLGLYLQLMSIAETQEDIIGKFKIGFLTYIIIYVYIN
jgi:hypothetical protein